MLENDVSATSLNSKPSSNDSLHNNGLDEFFSTLHDKVDDQELNSRLTALNRSNAIIEFDLSGNILFVNNLFLELLGYEEHEVLGQHHNIFIDTTETNPIEYDKFWANLRKGNFQEDEFRRVRKDGQSVWLRGNYNPIFDHSGKPYKVIKIASDITARKKQQIEIDAIKQAIYKSSLAIEFDMNGFILSANAIFENIMGYRIEEIIGKHHSILIDKDYVDSDEYKNFWQNLKLGKYQEGEFGRVTKSGQNVFIKGNYNPIFNTEGKPYKILKIATDVSVARNQAEELVLKANELEKKQLELTELNAILQHQSELQKIQHLKLQQINHELERQTAVLEQKNSEVELAKLLVEQKTTQLEISSKYKSEFMANMSHELRTPLNSLLILSQYLASNGSKNLTEEQVESSEIIYRSGKDLLLLINEILDLSKIEAGKMTLNICKVSVESIIKNIHSDFNHQAQKKGLSFKIFLEDNLPQTITTDHQRLQQVLRNIISNAIKFTSRGEVFIYFSFQDGRLAIKIVDTGIGIPVTEQSSIFEPFHQADSSTSRKYGGTGLGLSISRDLIKLLEGEITLESNPKKGSVFTVLIPFLVSNKLHDEALAVHQIQEESVVSHTFKADNTNRDNSNSIKSSSTYPVEAFIEKKVLLVDDDMRNIFAISKILREKGMLVLKAEDGKVALNILKNQSDIDLIIMDIMMPDMNGYEVMKRIREQNTFRNLPIIALTAKAMKEDEQKCIDAGANGYLTKPTDVEQLLDMIGKQFENKQQSV